jgi:hypothetical protein
MAITITITGNPAEAGVAAAAAATGAASAQAYLQARVEALCAEMVTQYRVGIISSGEYVLRFTPAENDAITVAATTDPLIDGLLKRVKESAEVVLYSDEVQQGVGYLVMQGLIAAERAAQILAYDVAVDPAEPVEPEPEPEPEPEEPVVDPEEPVEPDPEP